MERYLHKFRVEIVKAMTALTAGLYLPGNWDIDPYKKQLTPQEVQKQLIVANYIRRMRSTMFCDQWRSNRLCRLCSAQGPPAFRGPQPPGP